MADNRRQSLIISGHGQTANPWPLPEFSQHSPRVASAEKEARERAKRAEQEEVEALPDTENQVGISAAELEAIINEAETEGRERGYSEGFGRGHEEGLQQGRASGESTAYAEHGGQLQLQQSQLRSLCEALISPLADEDEAITRLLVETVCVLSRAIIQRELQTDSGHIVALVERALQALPIGTGACKLYLNPDDIDAVEASLKGQDVNCQLRPDAGMAAGGVRVETSESRVDFSVEERLRRVLQEFTEHQLADMEKALPEQSTKDREAAPATEASFQADGQDAAAAHKGPAKEKVAAVDDEGAESFSSENQITCASDAADGGPQVPEGKIPSPPSPSGPRQSDAGDGGEDGQ